VLVISAFALPGVALWWHAWDGHLASVLTCACGDAGQTVWFVEWPAYALAHGIDPFFSGALQAPDGVNLLANASAVPIGLALAPVTLTAGPIVSTNLALTLAPAFSAWACWLTCRRFVEWPPAAIVAGLVFGYSPFVVTNLELGHLGLAFLVAPPLLLLAGHQVLFGPARGRRRWAALAGALLGLQFLLSSEILAIVIVVGAPVVLVAVVWGIRSIAPVPELGRALLVGGAVGAVVLALPLWAFFAGRQHLHGPLWHVQGNAAAALWSPGAYQAPADVLIRLGGYEGRAGPPSAFLGPVAIVLAGVAVGVAWRRRVTWLLALGALVAAVCSLGTTLWLTTRHPTGLWLPWRLVASWPLLEDVIPQRFSAVTDLCVAMLLGVGVEASWRAARRRVPGRLWRVGASGAVCVAGLAAGVSVWPTYQVPFATQGLVVPTWYRDAAPRLSPGTVVLSYPFPFPLDGNSAPMVWQSLDVMRFRLAGGYIKVPDADGRPLSTSPVPEPYRLLSALTARAGGALPALGPARLGALRAALERWRVGEVVVLPLGRDPVLARSVLTKVIGRPPRRELGAWTWRLLPESSSADDGAGGPDEVVRSHPSVHRAVVGPRTRGAIR